VRETSSHQVHTRRMSGCHRLRRRVRQSARGPFSAHACHARRPEAKNSLRYRFNRGDNMRQTDEHDPVERSSQTSRNLRSHSSLLLDGTVAGADTNLGSLPTTKNEAPTLGVRPWQAPALHSRLRPVFEMATGQTWPSLPFIVRHNLCGLPQMRYLLYRGKRQTVAAVSLNLLQPP
jgi:hypothetical protein